MKERFVENTRVNSNDYIKKDFLNESDQTILVEEKGGGVEYKARAVYTFPISRPDQENLNGRVYNSKLWEKTIKTMKETPSYGLMDHPANEGSTKDIWCVWRNLRFNEKKDRVVADAYLIGSWGQEVLEILEAGGQIGLSTSGFGDFLEDKKTINPDTFELERVADFVFNPSYEVFGKLGDKQEGLEMKVENLDEEKKKKEDDNVIEPEDDDVEEKKKKKEDDKSDDDKKSDDKKDKDKKSDDDDESDDDDVEEKKKKKEDDKSDDDDESDDDKKDKKDKDKKSDDDEKSDKGKKSEDKQPDDKKPEEPPVDGDKKDPVEKPNNGDKKEPEKKVDGDKKEPEEEPVDGDKKDPIEKPNDGDKKKPESYMVTLFRKNLVASFKEAQKLSGSEKLVALESLLSYFEDGIAEDLREEIANEVEALKQTVKKVEDSPVVTEELEELTTKYESALELLDSLKVYTVKLKEMYDIAQAEKNGMVSASIYRETVVYGELLEKQKVDLEKELVELKKSIREQDKQDTVEPEQTKVEESVKPKEDYSDVRPEIMAYYLDLENGNPLVVKIKEDILKNRTLMEAQKTYIRLKGLVTDQSVYDRRVSMKKNTFAESSSHGLTIHNEGWV